MNERQKKRPGVEKMPASVTANDLARGMVIKLAGQRDWNDTRESWLARGARHAGLTLRRARAIFYQEPIRLTADEYLAIQQRFEALNGSLASLSGLAGPAGAGNGGAPRSEGALVAGDRAEVDRSERPSTVAAVRPAE